MLCVIGFLCFCYISDRESQRVYVLVFFIIFERDGKVYPCVVRIA